MKTLILPGFSPKNKDWAYLTKSKLESKFSVEVIEWDHWGADTSTDVSWNKWIDRETAKVIRSISSEEVNILAKSIGSVIGMKVLESISNQVNKIIICGIPLNDISEDEKKLYVFLKNVSKSKILCIQNSNDNHGTFDEANSFVHSIDQGINVILKEGDNHEYPYTDEFLKFFED